MPPNSDFGFLLAHLTFKASPSFSAQNGLLLKYADNSLGKTTLQDGLWPSEMMWNPEAPGPSVTSFGRKQTLC